MGVIRHKGSNKNGVCCSRKSTQILIFFIKCVNIHETKDNQVFTSITLGIKLCNHNIGFNGRFYSFPYFCAFLLKKWFPYENR